MRGHIRKRGKKWAIVVDIGKDENGTRKQKWFSGYRTKKEADADLARIITELEKGVYIDTSNMTFKDYIEYWLENHGSSLASKTYNRYKNLLELRVIPWIGDIPIDKLKPIHLQQFYGRLLKEGRLDGKEGILSQGSINYHHAVIHRILQTAFTQELVTRNIADLVEVPIVEEDPDTKEHVKILTSEQIKTLEESAKNTSYYMMIFTNIRTGLRRGELLALRWSDIKDGKINVVRAVTYTPETGLKYGPTKNKKRRSIDMSDELRVALKQHYKKQLEYKMFLGEDYHDNDLVFCQEDGNPMHPDTISSWFPKFLDKIKLPRLNFHCLRHTHASLLLKAGVDIKIISERLGHSSIRITYDVYSHLLPGQQKEAADKLEELLS